MVKTIGYLCTKKYSEAKLYMGFVKADAFYIDLATDRGWSSFAEFNRLVAEVEKDIKVIMPSIVGICTDLEEAYQILRILRDKGVKLSLLNPTKGEEIFLTEGGFKTLEVIFNLRKDLPQSVIEIKAENQFKHRNQEVFPEGFYEVFVKYKQNELSAEVAAKKLNIDVHKFYRLVREFS